MVLGLLICGPCSSSPVWPVVFSGLHRTVLRSLWSEVWSSVLSGLFLGGPKPCRITTPTIVLPVPGPPESSKRLETSSKSWLLGVPRPLQRPPGLSNPFQLASKALQSLPTGLRSLQNAPQVAQKPSPNHPKPVLRPSKPTSGPAAEGVARWVAVSKHLWWPSHKQSKITYQRASSEPRPSMLFTTLNCSSTLHDHVIMSYI